MAHTLVILPDEVHTELGAQEHLIAARALRDCGLVTPHGGR